MFRIKLVNVFSVLFPSAIVTLLGGCSEAYLPRLEGATLNPDITLLRTGEMVEGVKCALVSFMHEREQDLLKARIAKAAIRRL